MPFSFYSWLVGGETKDKRWCTLRLWFWQKKCWGFKSNRVRVCRWFQQSNMQQKRLKIVDLCFGPTGPVVSTVDYVLVRSHKNGWTAMWRFYQVRNECQIWLLGTVMKIKGMKPKHRGFHPRLQVWKLKDDKMLKICRFSVCSSSDKRAGVFCDCWNPRHEVFSTTCTCAVCVCRLIYRH